MNGRNEVAYAKINLALHVRRREPDGYHLIETLFAFAEDGDELVAEAEPGLRIVGPFASGLQADEHNLVLRAERAFRATFGGAETGFRLDKRLPVASGIGGGSADAGAALRLLARSRDITEDEPRLWELARGLGADVPACLASRPARGDGRGDELATIENSMLAGLPLLLVNPRAPLSTGPVFAAWDRTDRGGLSEGNPIAVAHAGRNDLERPARMLLPVIDRVLALLSGVEGALLVRMSGSGATCFALFERDKQRDAADRRLHAAEPDWWRMATRLRA